jgi:dTDP-4-dehydrorhamnose 3,5-epimerase
LKIRPLSIDGAFEITPVQHGDPRGMFMELYRFDRLAEAVGHPLRLAQSNLSTSTRGVLRGLHFADVPPGQAKYVSCVRGSGVDVVVDLRVGSPTYGQHETVVIDDVDRRAVYVGEGLGHAFCATSEDATLLYFCSETYAPQREHTIDALDPALGISWPVAEPIRSERDAAAPSLAQAREQGLLSDYEQCISFVEGLKKAADTFGS